MSDRSALLGLLFAVAATATRAQSVDELRAELQRAESRLGIAVARQAQLRETRLFGSDAGLRSGGRRVRYRTADLSPRDSAALSRGLELGVTRLREWYGDAGASLADTASLGVTSERRGAFRPLVIFSIASPNFTRVRLSRPVDEEEVARFVIHEAGDRLSARTPTLRRFAGYSAMLPGPREDAEIARRLATSWAAAGRRCAAGAIGACATVAEPIGPDSPLDLYFEPSDFRAVVASANRPAIADSVFYASRRRCLAGADTACARLVRILDPADPIGDHIRGSILTHALALGGRDGIARLLAARDTVPLAALARAAGTSEDALLSSWHTKIYAAVRRGPFDLVVPFLTTFGWAALLLAVATRRRYL